MAIHKHRAHTRSERLIQSMDALTAVLKEVLERLPEPSKPKRGDETGNNVMLLKHSA